MAWKPNHLEGLLVIKCIVSAVDMAHDSSWSTTIFCNQCVLLLRACLFIQKHSIFRNSSYPERGTLMGAYFRKSSKLSDCNLGWRPKIAITQVHDPFLVVAVSTAEALGPWSLLLSVALVQQFDKSNPHEATRSDAWVQPRYAKTLFLLFRTEQVNVPTNQVQAVCSNTALTRMHRQKHMWQNRKVWTNGQRMAKVQI